MKQAHYDEQDKRLLAALDAPLPLELCPFQVVATAAGMNEETVLQKIQSWCSDGTIRRFGARVNHRRLGVRANGMSVWVVAEADMERAGTFMASLPEVSHCYERPAREGWPYTLYAMIHGPSRSAVMQVARYIAETLSLEQYEVLFSVREFKKSAPKLFTGYEREDL